MSFTHATFEFRERLGIYETLVANNQTVIVGNPKVQALDFAQHRLSRRKKTKLSRFKNVIFQRKIGFSSVLDDAMMPSQVLDQCLRKQSKSVKPVIPMP